LITNPRHFAGETFEGAAVFDREGFEFRTALFLCAAGSDVAKREGEILVAGIGENFESVTGIVAP
jgi:hypothetical protein